jgi:hypothetical protein
VELGDQSASIIFRLPSNRVIKRKIGYYLHKTKQQGDGAVEEEGVMPQQKPPHRHFLGQLVLVEAVVVLG